MALPVLLLAAPLRASDFPENVIPHTLGVNLKNHSCSPAHVEAVKGSGATFIRRGFYWGSIEKEKGVYTFDEYDKLLDEADKQGLRVLGVLFGNNKVREDDGRGGVQTEEGRKGFAAFGAALAGHFKGRGILWEVWNEPNTKTFWRNDVKAGNNPEFAAEYTALVKETVAAMRAADPGVFVMAGSVSCLWEPSFNWTKSCFEQGILKSGIKAWSIHPYGFRMPEDHLGGYAKVRELLAEAGEPGFPLINSERGFAITKAKEGWSGGPLEQAQAHQAWHLARQMLLDRLAGIRLTIWYEWEMKPGDKEDFGLVSGGDKRPGWRALRTLADELSGFKFKQRLETGAPLDYLLLFQNAEGRRKLAAWTCPPPKSTPEQFTPHEIELSAEGETEINARGLYGEASKLPAPGGKLKLNLTGSPVYLDVTRRGPQRTQTRGSALNRKCIPACNWSLFGFLVLGRLEFNRPACC
ncbi:MAG: cellulase family glycosylhydrolase [Planctomycetota bacterium]|nr:cellulase family glycosylhydrolase [Planctomycetota bacterium]